MNSILKNIDTDLIDLEERLLDELRHLRKIGSDSPYCVINPVRVEELMLIRSVLQDALDNSGDRHNLSLRTEEHETLQARLKVLRSLLARDIPAAFLDASHDEVKKQRHLLEQKAADARRAAGTGDAIGTKKTPQEHARNPNNITAEEEQKFVGKSEFKDAGLYSASHELAVICEHLHLHYDEGKSIEDVIKGRAEFEARELTHGHATAKVAGPGIAQSPDEIRKKLSGRRIPTSRGGASFAARDLSNRQVPEAEPPQPRPTKIAQSPEEIRRKLAERKAEPAGKAVFGAKDITHVAPIEPAPRKVEEKPPEPSRPLTGKASFGSTKDIASINEYVPPPPRRKQPEKEPERPTGRAIFESKDLSDPKPD